MPASVVLGPPQVFRRARAVLGESPYWSDGALHWVDIVAGVLTVSPADGAVDGADDTRVPLPPPVAAIAPAEDGGRVIAYTDRIVLGAADGAERRELARVQHAHEGMRLNEGKVDPEGRFVIGSMDPTGRGPDGAWYRVGPSGGAAVLLGGITTPNSLEWSADGRTACFADTAASVVYRAPWSAEQGFGEPVEWVTGGMPDGIVGDADGCFWSARYGEGHVVRLAADGTELERVELPAPNLTGVAFGGVDLDRLFVCSARENLDEAALEAHPLSGSVFAVPTSTRGLPVRRFRP